MGPIGVPEMIFIFVLALLIFGPRKLPELGRTVGRAMTEFRRASTEVRVAIEDEMREMERQAREVTREARQAVEEGMPSLEGEPAGSGTIAREPQPSAVPPEPGPQAADGDHAKS